MVVPLPNTCTMTPCNLRHLSQFTVSMCNGFWKINMALQLWKIKVGTRRGQRNGKTSNFSDHTSGCTTTGFASLVKKKKSKEKHFQGSALSLFRNVLLFLAELTLLLAISRHLAPSRSCASTIKGFTRNAQRTPPASSLPDRPEGRRSCPADDENLPRLRGCRCRGPSRPFPPPTGPRQRAGRPGRRGLGGAWRATATSLSPAPPAVLRVTTTERGHATPHPTAPPVSARRSLPCWWGWRGAAWRWRQCPACWARTWCRAEGGGEAGGLRRRTAAARPRRWDAPRRPQLRPALEAARGARPAPAGVARAATRPRPPPRGCPGDERPCCVSAFRWARRPRRGHRGSRQGRRGLRRARRQAGEQAGMPRLPRLLGLEVTTENAEPGKKTSTCSVHWTEGGTTFPSRQVIKHIIMPVKRPVSAFGLIE